MTALAKPRIKVCGLTRAEDAELAMELGAWAVGFVLVPSSPRAITPERAAGIIARLEHLARLGGRPGPRAVAVTVNEGMAELGRAVRVSGVDTVQLHGEETESFCRSLRRAMPEVALIKALRPRGAGDLTRIPAFLESCEAVLLDAHVPGERGGTGVVGDWRLAREARGLGRIVLAGGLTPRNIRQAIGEARPYAVDVSSGLEDGPGIKSEAKMRRFFENAGPFAGRLEEEP